MYTYLHDGEEFILPEQSFYRVSLKLLVTDKQGRALLVKNDKGRWAVPGGGWDHGESVEDCIRREIMEELGVELASFNPKPITFWAGPSSRGNYLCLKILLAGTLANYQFTTSDEAQETAFFSVKEMESLNFDADEKGIIAVCRSNNTKKK
jgi:ADP-ribose pyrophosphatase YjhB (NUDIX family)